MKQRLLRWLTSNNRTRENRGRVVRGKASPMAQQLAAMGRFGQPLVVAYK